MNPFKSPRMISLAVLDRIARERKRQEELRESGKFTFTCRSPMMDDNKKLRVLVEEVGEVAEAIDRVESSKAGHLPARDHLRDELVQVAAVAVAWLESMEDASCEVLNRPGENAHSEEVRRLRSESPARAAMFNNRGITSNT